MSKCVAASRKAGNLEVKRRDKVAELATENAALKGHIRTLILAGEEAVRWLPMGGPCRDDLIVAINAAKLAK